MILINRSTGKETHAIFWNGKNQIEFKQFGVTGTKHGRQTKIDCSQKAYVKIGRVFCAIDQGTYVVIEAANKYVPYTAEALYKKYREPEK